MNVSIVFASSPTYLKKTAVPTRTPPEPTNGATSAPLYVWNVDTVLRASPQMVGCVGCIDEIHLAGEVGSDLCEQVGWKMVKSSSVRFGIGGWCRSSDPSSPDTIPHKTSCRVRPREPRFATNPTSVHSLQEAGFMTQLLFDWEYEVFDWRVC